MQAVILAAGEGKRLRPFTDSMPKPMVNVQGRPILEYVISALPGNVKEIILVVGYKSDAIKKYFGDFFVDKRLSYVFQAEPKGTADALCAARNLLTSEYFILLNGDDLYHPEDLKIFLSPRPTVFVKHSKTPERFGVCLLNEEGFIAKIIEKPQNPPSSLVNTGAYILNHEIWDVPVAVLPGRELYLAEQIGDWAEKRPVCAHEVKFWNPINNPEELEEAKQCDLKAIFPSLN